MNGVISETVRDACIEVEARGCTVNVDGELTTKVLGDRELLRRAVENVLRNAVRYSPPKAKIDIVLKEKDDTASITCEITDPAFLRLSWTRYSIHSFAWKNPEIRRREELVLGYPSRSERFSCTTVPFWHGIPIRD